MDAETLRALFTVLAMSTVVGWVILGVLVIEKVFEWLSRSSQG
jgi:ABC-type dipeptide/oligopeptide/nickel transport system permease component